MKSSKQEMTRKYIFGLRHGIGHYPLRAQSPEIFRLVANPTAVIAEYGSHKGRTDTLIRRHHNDCKQESICQLLRRVSNTSNNTSIPNYLICKAEIAISQFSIQVSVQQHKCWLTMDTCLEKQRTLRGECFTQQIAHEACPTQIQRRGIVTCNRRVLFELGYEYTNYAFIHHRLTRNYGT